MRAARKKTSRRIGALANIWSRNLFSRLAYAQRCPATHGLAVAPYIQDFGIGRRAKGTRILGTAIILTLTYNNNNLARQHEWGGVVHRSRTNSCIHSAKYSGSRDGNRALPHQRTKMNNLFRYILWGDEDREAHGNVLAQPGKSPPTSPLVFPLLYHWLYQNACK